MPPFPHPMLSGDEISSFDNLALLSVFPHFSLQSCDLRPRVGRMAAQLMLFMNPIV